MTGISQSEAKRLILDATLFEMMKTGASREAIRRTLLDTI